MSEPFVQACPHATLADRAVEQRTENVDGFGDVSTRVIDFQQDGRPEPIASSLMARLKMFASVEGYLIKRSVSKPKRRYSNLQGL
jgi:hypothetical protein